MASLPAPNTGDTKTRRTSGTGAAPSTAGVLSSAFRLLPFPSPVPSSKPSIVDHTVPNQAHNPHFALISAADRCFKALTDSLSGHPLIRSLHSGLQSFCQSPRRSPRIATLPAAHSFAAVLPGDSVAGLVVANGIINFLNLYNTLLVVRLVLTWFPNSPPAIVSPLSTICDPYLNIFRGIIPPLGGTLDLSPILAFIVLNAFTSTAAALPAELPETTISQQNISSQQLHQHLTTTQKKWMRRLCGQRPKK